MAAKPFYITTAISYPNGPPHIGHAYEAIATDAIARFMRLDGYDVFFLTGTDEHGQKIQQTAAREGLTPRQLLDRNVPLFEAMVKLLDCSNNDFIHTTEQRHHRSSEEIWRRMEQNGDIYLSKYAGWYSVRDEAYYAEDETALNDNKQRISTKTGTPVEWVEEESYFFRLSAYQEKLLALYASDPNYVLPKERLNEVASFVRGGLQDLSISRTTFDWGVRVPGSNGHIMYVWVDALTNYITAVGYPDTESEMFRRYWPADLHVIGKDIVRFHAVYWPAFLMSAGIDVPRRIFSHGFLFNRGEKMSKSVGNVIDPFSLVKTYGVDPLRYFFLREVPFGQDGNYSHDAIINRINADLANDLGNLAQRSLTMVARQSRRHAAEAWRAVRSRQRDPRRRRRHDRQGTGGHDNPATAPGPQRRLDGGRGRQPLFRRRSAVGSGKDRPGAAGNGPLRHRGSAAAGRHSRATFRAGIGREAARSARHPGGPTRFLVPRRQASHRAGHETSGAGAGLSALCRGRGTRRAIIMLIDSHCHLDFPDFADELDAVVARARAAGIARMVTISTRVHRHAGLIAIAERFADVYASVGTHPHYAHEESEITAADLVARTRHPKVVAIGEAGLDYHYDRSPRDAQERGFRTHIAAARETGLPLVIYSRNADADTARILEEETGQGAFPAVLHCFTGGPDLARRAVALGLFISFTGILTFKNSAELRAIAAGLPPDRILVETDAPYLAPLPFRGKRNEPAFVVETAKVLAETRGVSFDDIARQTSDNFFRLFSKVPRPANAAAA